MRLPLGDIVITKIDRLVNIVRRVAESRYANDQIIRPHQRHHHNRRPDWMPVTKGHTRSNIGSFYQNRCSDYLHKFESNNATFEVRDDFFTIGWFYFQFMESNYSLITIGYNSSDRENIIGALFVLMTKEEEMSPTDGVGDRPERVSHQTKYSTSGWF